MSKPIDELTVADLHAHPIWEYSMDEEAGDETYVCPTGAEIVPNETSYDVYHVACDLTIATGARFTGFLQICNGELHFPVPIVVGGPEDYWCLDAAPARRERAKFEAFFKVNYPGLFPMTWSLRVPVSGENSLRTGVYSPDAAA